MVTLVCLSSLALVRCLLLRARLSRVESVTDQVERVRDQVEKLIIQGQTHHNPELITPMLESGDSSRRTTM